MARQKRYPLLLDPEYPPERQVFGAINSLPDGDRASVLRVLVLLGHSEIEGEKAMTQQQEPNVEG